MNKNKVDVIIDLGLRILIFTYSAIILSLSTWQLKRDKQFLIAIGLFAFTCTSIYLFDSVYNIITGKNIDWMHKIIYGTQNTTSDFPDIKKTFKIIFYLILLLIFIYLFGLFLIIFLAIFSFPILYDKQNPFISFIVAIVTTSSFYYVFVNLMGLYLYKGYIFGF